MERIEVGRYAEPAAVGGFAGWVNPERETDHAVPRWCLWVTQEGHVVLGVRDDERDELVFAGAHPPPISG